MWYDVGVGTRYKGHTYDELRGPILYKERVDISTRLDDLNESLESLDA